MTLSCVLYFVRMLLYCRFGLFLPLLTKYFLKIKVLNMEFYFNNEIRYLYFLNFIDRQFVLGLGSSMKWSSFAGSASCNPGHGRRANWPLFSSSSPEVPRQPRPSSNLFAQVLKLATSRPRISVTSASFVCRSKINFALASWLRACPSLRVIGWS